MPSTGLRNWLAEVHLWLCVGGYLGSGAIQTSRSRRCHAVLGIDLGKGSRGGWGEGVLLTL